MKNSPSHVSSKRFHLHLTFFHIGSAQVHHAVQEREASLSDFRESMDSRRSPKRKTKLVPSKASFSELRRSERHRVKPASQHHGVTASQNPIENDFEGGVCSEIVDSSRLASHQCLPALSQFVGSQEEYWCLFCPKMKETANKHNRHMLRSHAPSLKALKREERDEELKAQEFQKKLKAAAKQAKQEEDALRKGSFFAIDTETNHGGHERFKEVVEVAVVRLDRNAETDSAQFTTVFHRFFNPLNNISAEAQSVHGYTRASLEARGARGFTVDDADEIVAKLKGCKGIIGHNVDFDKQVLGDQFERVGAKRASAHWDKVAPFICTQKLATVKHQLSGHQSSLAAVYQRLIGEPLQNHHSAKADAIAAAKLWLKLKE